MAPPPGSRRLANTEAIEGLVGINENMFEAVSLDVVFESPASTEGPARFEDLSFSRDLDAEAAFATGSTRITLV